MVRRLSIYISVVENLKSIYFSGRRKCVGENFAKSNLFIFFASFMHSFDFEFNGGKLLPSMEGVDGITIAPKSFQVKLKSR